MNEALKKNESYQKRYMKSHRMLCVCLDREKDKDIVTWLEKQESISESVKSVLKQYILKTELLKH